MASAAPACTDARPEAANERWVVTENSAVDIDWDAIAEAYQQAEGPEDFERRVNEIYGGSEVISVAVRDVDASTQLVTGFFDRDANGSDDESEKVFSIRRDIVKEGEAQVQVQGYGPYAGYHSPLMSIASGMLVGSMLSRAFSPGYMPMYATPYVTSPSRRGDLVMARDNYRQQNPSKFQSGQASKSGRQYGRGGGAFGGGSAPKSRSAPRSRGGGRFGARMHRNPSTRVVRVS